MRDRRHAGEGEGGERGVGLVGNRESARGAPLGGDWKSTLNRSLHSSY